jgi:hypothetical protein
MKKVTLFAIAILGLSLASCKKDRVCTCTETDSTSGTIVTYETTYYEVKKADARQNCIGSQTKSTSGSVSVTGDKTTCELK